MNTHNPKYTLITPSPDRMDDLVRLCEAHAIFEECDYDPSNKAENLKKDLFSPNPKLYCKVAVINDQYVGYCTWMRQYATWDAQEYIYMDTLYLDDAYRSMGIGVALVGAIKAYGIEHNIHLIQWQTPDFNKRAMKFYKRIGATSKSKERFFLEF